MKRNFLILLLLLLLALPAVLPLFRQGMFVSDDGDWMIIRFSAFHQALRDGQFPVRFLGRLNQGYGYPVADFLYPGFMYLSEIPKILGFNFVESVKIIMGLSLIASSVFTYLWFRENFSFQASLLGGLYYLYAPYHLWDIYKRGSVGEILALAVVPFILWAFESKKIFFYTLGIGMLILSHNTLALLFLPAIIIYAILRKTLDTKYLILNTILGFGLSAFFWIPAIFDLKYTKFSQTRISDFGSFFAGIDLLGIGIVILLFSGALAFFNKKFRRDKIAIFFFLTGLAAAFLAMPISKFLWNYLPIAFIQFPFRVLSIFILSCAYLLCWLLSRLNGKLKLASFILAGVFLVLSLPFIKPVFTDKAEGFYTTNEDTTTVQKEYMAVWAEKNPEQRAVNKVEVIRGSSEIRTIINNNRKIVFETLSGKPAEVRINTVYFPGWQAKIDGKSVAISFDNPEGLMIISAPAGKHVFEILWAETPLRQFADYLSILSFGGLVILVLKKGK